MRIILVPLSVLAIALSTPAYAYYPEWPRTHIRNVANVDTLLSHDFNGDGRTDVVGRRNDQTVMISLAEADRSFAAPVVIYTGTALTDIALGDANGDGHTDVVVSDSGTSSLVVVPSNGDATFGTPIVTVLSMAPAEIATADFNGDGATDVALYSSSAALLAVFTNDGGGHFAEVWRTDAESIVGRMLTGDIDNDGADDFLVRTATPTSQYLLYFGRGDLTFDAPVSVPAAATSQRVVLGDLDDDGDLEIISTEVPSSVRVLVNNGSRTFAAPSDYSTLIPSGSNAVDLVVAEVTGDDHADVVTVLLVARRLVTLAGNGNGTLRAPVYAPVPGVTPFTSMFPQHLASGDFTGDGRIDLAVAGSSNLAMFANAAGDGTLDFKATYPVVSTDQHAKFELNFWITFGFQPSYPDMPPYPTGTVTLKNGDTPVGTGSFQNYVATIEASPLPVGTHTITAEFAGDENYRSITTSSVEQEVIAEKTTITLTGINEEEGVPFGQDFTIVGHLTSPRPGSILGTSSLYINGVRQSYSLGDTPSWLVRPEDVGTYEYFVEYEGSIAHPPSVSEVYRQTVTKGRAVVQIEYSGQNHILRYGQQGAVLVTLTSDPWGHRPEGTVRLFDGSTLLDTKVAVACCAGSTTVSLDLPLLSPGVHHLRATYEGSEKFNPAASDYERYTILPAEGFVVDVYTDDYSGPRIVAAGLFPAPLGTRYVIYRKVGNEGWTVVDYFTFYPVAEVRNPTPGVVYAFRMEAYNNSSELIASSNADATIRFSFSDKPLVSGLTIKAQHVQETVAATNILRAATGLSPLTLSDAGPGQTIRLTHLTSLRNAINEARAALGVAPVVFSNDATAGAVVRALHFQELRDTMQ